MLGGRMELGLVPGINADYFRPFGLDYELRKSPTLEFIDYMQAAFGETQPFSYHGHDFHTEHAQLAVQPVQRPHPPLWMMSRDPQTLEFCARGGTPGNSSDAASRAPPRSWPICSIPTTSAGTSSCSSARPTRSRASLRPPRVPACSTCSWASSISPTCRRPT